MLATINGNSAMAATSPTKIEVPTITPLDTKGVTIIAMYSEYNYTLAESALGRVCNTHSSSENISFWI